MKNIPLIVSGQALIGEELALRPVDIVIESGIITAIEETTKAPRVWICPAFFNAHTHLGDTLAMDCGVKGDLASLVTPPDGLKHRLLAAASPQDLVRGMRVSIEGMIAGGTAGCADFREGGIAGVSGLREAAEGLPFRPIIFGRDGGNQLPTDWGSAAPVILRVLTGLWQKHTLQERRSPFMPVNGMPQMLTMHSLSTRIFSFTVPTQQENSSANVRTGRFPLRSVPGPTGLLVSPHQHTTLPCSLCRIWGVRYFLAPTMSCLCLRICFLKWRLLPRYTGLIQKSCCVRLFRVLN